MAAAAGPMFFDRKAGANASLYTATESKVGGLKSIKLEIVDSDKNWSRAEITLFGAHVTHWENGTAAAADGPILFLSSKAILDGTKAIRGGIPLIFPQFSGMGSLPAHGFARTANWTVRRTQTDDSSVCVVFGLTSTPETMKVWPHAFDAEYTVSLTGTRRSRLGCALKVTNTAPATASGAFTFTAALHTYFRCSHIDHTTVRDLRGVTFLDQLTKSKTVTPATPAGASLAFTKETDSVYFGVPASLEIVDAPASATDGKSADAKTAAAPSVGRIIRIDSGGGFRDAVIWNPWIAKSKTMADFGAEEYKSMVCVESAVIDPVATVAAGATWIGAISLFARAADSAPESETDIKRLLAALNGSASASPKL